MKKQTKQYVVNFDMAFSHDVRVNARTAGEAKKKAWIKFSKRITRSKFNVDIIEKW